MIESVVVTLVGAGVASLLTWGAHRQGRTIAAAAKRAPGRPTHLTIVLSPPARDS
jgi:hypothetical protein